MKCIQSIAEMKALSTAWRQAGETISFVPTMGSLHAGHLLLVKQGLACADHCVVSIFVNPLQFGPGEDYERYPRNEAEDLSACREAGVDAVFCPAADELYPAGHGVRVHAGSIGDIYEGAQRPGHFDGVLTVVAKLFHMVAPHVAVFGEKDAQQLFLIRRMAADLNMSVSIQAAPLVRDTDGLALSSRNRYLADEDRRAALSLSRGLQKAADAYAAGERKTAELEHLVTQEIEAAGRGDIDYVTCIHEADWKRPEILSAPTRLITAVRYGATRLLDNIRLGGQAD